MDNVEYKKKVSQWNVKRRNIIEETLALLKDENPSLYEVLLPVLDQQPIEKPPKHSGGKETDFFEIPFPKNKVQEIIDVLFDLEAAAVPDEASLDFEDIAKKSKEANRIAALVDEWNQLNTRNY